MKQIDIEDDLYKYILANIEEFGETPSQILRRLLQLPTNIVLPELAEPKSVPVAPVDKPQRDPITAVDSNNQAAISQHEIKADTVKPLKKDKIKVEQTGSVTDVSLPDAFAHGLVALFNSEMFQNEPVITNKFKMMLTTMYYENRTEFVRASKVAKGRSRDYLGQNLEELLASSNKEEVDLLIASKPREIPYTPFWVVTNANTGRKRIILTQVMASMGYPHHLIERIKEVI